MFCPNAEEQKSQRIAEENLQGPPGFGFGGDLRLVLCVLGVSALSYQFKK